MKLNHVLLLIIIAWMIAFSDPYGLLKASPQGKQRKSIITDTLTTNPAGTGAALRLEFQKGDAHNHPLFAIWAEDTSGNYIQTLYVSRSIATSLFNFGEQSGGTWTRGVVRRPAAVPFWGHKRNVVAADGLYIPLPDDPLPDAYSGATPKNDFILDTRLDKPGPEAFYVLLELNQPWDWNAYWTNNKYPDDEDYKASSQPAVVYRALVRADNPGIAVPLELLGHSHYAGKDGSLTTDVSTLTTGLEIADKIFVTLLK